MQQKENRRLRITKTDMSKETERIIEQAREETILITGQAEENRKRELADEEASKRNADSLKRLVEEGRTEK